jgi:hypothetical protein
MILRVSLTESIRLVGKRGGTTAQNLRRVRATQGINAGPVSLTRYAEIPSRAILCLSPKTGNRYGHWMLMWDGLVYDPASFYEKSLTEGWEIISFIPLRKSGNR